MRRATVSLRFHQMPSVQASAHSSTTPNNSSVDTILDMPDVFLRVDRHTDHCPHVFTGLSFTSPPSGILLKGIQPLHHHDLPSVGILPGLRVPPDMIPHGELHLLGHLVVLHVLHRLFDCSHLSS